MKIDFSDINDINSSYIHQMDLLSTAIYDAATKDELIALKLKIDIAALNCRCRIIADMAEDFSNKCVNHTV